MIRLAALLSPVLLVSCAGSSRYMVLDETPDPATPPPGKALVVFVRPSHFARPADFTVIDDRGTFVGQVPAIGHVKHVVDPGRYRFIVWAENTETIDAELAADKTYYVEVTTHMGLWAARADLDPVKRGDGEWEKVAVWLADCQEWDRDPQLAADWQREKAQGVEKQITRAAEAWNGYDEEEKAAHTLRAGDGR